MGNDSLWVPVKERAVGAQRCPTDRRNAFLIPASEVRAVRRPKLSAVLSAVHVRPPVRWVEAGGDSAGRACGFEQGLHVLAYAKERSKQIKFFSELD